MAAKIYYQEDCNLSLLEQRRLSTFILKKKTDLSCLIIRRIR